MTNTLKITDIYNSSISEVVVPTTIPNVSNTGNITGVPIMSVSGKQNIAYIAYETGETVQITATGATSGIIQAIGKSESDISAARVAAGGSSTDDLYTVGCWVDPHAEKTYMVELNNTSGTVKVLGYVLPHDSSPVTVTKFSDISYLEDYSSKMSTTENLSFICCGHTYVSNDPEQLPIRILLWSASSGFFESTISSIPNWIDDNFDDYNDFVSVIVKSVVPFEAYMLVVRASGLIIYKLSGVKETPTVEEFDFIPTPERIPHAFERLAPARLMNISKLPGEFELGISYLIPVPITDPGNDTPWDRSGFDLVWSSVIKVSDRQSIMDSLDAYLEIKQYNSKPVKLSTELLQFMEYLVGGPYSVSDNGLLGADSVVTPIVSRRGADSILIYPDMRMTDSNIFSGEPLPGGPDPLVW